MLNESEYNEHLAQLARFRLGREAFGFREIEQLIDSAKHNTDLLCFLIERALEGLAPDSLNRCYMITFEDHDRICHQLLQVVESVDVARKAYELASRHEARARAAVESLTTRDRPADTRPAADLPQGVKVEAPKV